MKYKIKDYMPKAVIVVAIFASFSATAECFYDVIQSTAPDSRFNVNNDGTVTDKSTGLIWKQCSEGQTVNATCTGQPAPYYWQDAIARANLANNVNFADASNWRLPNIKELVSLNEYACQTPMINTNVFPNTTTVVDRRYWSSTTKSGGLANPTVAWYLNIDNGEVFYRDKDANQYHVRLVRSPN